MYHNRKQQQEVIRKLEILSVQNTAAKTFFLNDQNEMSTAKE